jgi:hypothetical protein
MLRATMSAVKAMSSDSWNVVCAWLVAAAPRASGSDAMVVARPLRLSTTSGPLRSLSVPDVATLTRAIVCTPSVIGGRGDEHSASGADESHTAASRGTTTSSTYARKRSVATSPACDQARRSVPRTVMAAPGAPVEGAGGAFVQLAVASSTAPTPSSADARPGWSRMGTVATIARLCVVLPDPRARSTVAGRSEPA